MPQWSKITKLTINSKILRARLNLFNFYLKLTRIYSSIQSLVIAHPRPAGLEIDQLRQTHMVFSGGIMIMSTYVVKREPEIYA